MKFLIVLTPFCTEIENCRIPSEVENQVATLSSDPSGLTVRYQ